ncbi:MAG: Fic family protein, partial [Roseovarius sp.]|nr:Fic family protein [Roseovarius sp.]
ALPPAENLETVPILKMLVRANRALAELKGRASSIPNQGILIDTLSLQEAKASSEIENIVTTQDELFQADLFPEGPRSPTAKEVALYRRAIKIGFDRVREDQGLIANRTLTTLYQTLKVRSDGFRATPGTALLNETTGERVYVPPQERPEIVSHMSELEKFVNVDEICDLDPLIKMALIHHQFESIHPFADGNGRVGRILNVLYLTKTGLLDIPILYLSRYVTHTKGDYYRLLQTVRDEDVWEDWILYMLAGVEETAQHALTLVEEIRTQMASVKRRMRDRLPKLYSQDLLNNLFRHPYTRVEFVVKDLGVTRQTAAKHLDKLADKGFVTKRSSGKHNYYVNDDLVELFVVG